MSKQLAIAASACILSMTALALSAGPSRLTDAEHGEGATSQLAAPPKAFSPF